MGSDTKANLKSGTVIGVPSLTGQNWQDFEENLNKDEQIIFFDLIRSILQCFRRTDPRPRKLLSIGGSRIKSLWIPEVVGQRSISK